MSRSEFGRGLTYCLGLFLAHAERYGEKLHDEKFRVEFERFRLAELWFNGASDHLYELEIPEALPKSLQKRLKRFQDKVLNWGHGFPKKKATEKDMIWSIQEAKNLLRLIDKAYGVETKKGDWE